MKNNIFNFVPSIVYRHKHKKSLFPYFGFQVYVGPFGSGKTISAVNDIFDILQNFPQVVFITNTAIKRCWQ